MRNKEIQLVLLLALALTGAKVARDEKGIMIDARKNIEAIIEGADENYSLQQLNEIKRLAERHDESYKWGLGVSLIAAGSSVAAAGLAVGAARDKLREN